MCSQALHSPHILQGYEHEVNFAIITLLVGDSTLNQRLFYKGVVLVDTTDNHKPLQLIENG